MKHESFNLYSVFNVQLCLFVLPSSTLLVYQNGTKMYMQILNTMLQILNTCNIVYCVRYIVYVILYLGINDISYMTNLRI